MIDFILTTLFRRVFGILPPSIPVVRKTLSDDFGNPVNLSPSHLEESLEAYADVTFGEPIANNTTNTTMKGFPIMFPDDFDLEVGTIPAPKAQPQTTPEPPKQEDKRIYDRDLNIEVKDGKYVG